MKNELEIIHCRANASKIAPSKPWELGQPARFMYMPAGITTITARFRDKAITVTLCVDEDAARTVQASFENLKANTPKQKPFGCVEHREEEASVHPVEFCWGSYDGDEGILVTAEPTKLGAENVNGRVHRSWSPSFSTDAEYAKAVLKGDVYSFPEGVRGSTSNPARITGIDFCVGTLTNKPAFRNMPPVKAKKGKVVEEDEDGITATWSPQAREAAKLARAAKNPKNEGLYERLNEHTQGAKRAHDAADAADGPAHYEAVASAAHEASGHAMKTSNVAMKLNDYEGHFKASGAHRLAMKTHHIATAHLDDEFDKDQVRYHEDQKEYHRKESIRHTDQMLKLQDTAKASDASSDLDDDTISATWSPQARLAALQAIRNKSHEAENHSAYGDESSAANSAEGASRLAHEASEKAHSEGDADSHATASKAHAHAADAAQHALDAHDPLQSKRSKLNRKKFEGLAHSHKSLSESHRALAAAGGRTGEEAAVHASQEDDSAETILSRLAEPQAIDILFKKLAPATVSVKSSENILARLSKDRSPN